MTATEARKTRTGAEFTKSWTSADGVELTKGTAVYLPDGRHGHVGGRFTRPSRSDGEHEQQRREPWVSVDDMVGPDGTAIGKCVRVPAASLFASKPKPKRVRQPANALVRELQQQVTQS